jgi:hypothetical protein
MLLAAVARNVRARLKFAMTRRFAEFVVVRRYDPLMWLAAFFFAALTAVATAPSVAHAEGLLDFLFHPFQDRPAASSYAEPSAPVMPPALGPESVRQGGASTNHGVAFCVRLCDGQHFPLERMANATPVETCRAMCPASKTKVYFGSEIGGAVSEEGARYADLDTAFVYRKQLVANCTCNGKDAFGLAPFDLSTDPTLRPGDIVSTKQGLMAFAGKNSNVAQFTPVSNSSVAAELNSVTTQVKVSRRNAPSVAAAPEDDAGTIAMPQAPPPPVNLGANYRGASAQ